LPLSITLWTVKCRWENRTKETTVKSWQAVVMTWQFGRSETVLLVLIQIQFRGGCHLKDKTY